MTGQCVNPVFMGVAKMLDPPALDPRRFSGALAGTGVTQDLAKDAHRMTQ